MPSASQRRFDVSLSAGVEMILPPSHSALPARAVVRKALRTKRASEAVPAHCDPASIDGLKRQGWTEEMWTTDEHGETRSDSTRVNRARFVPLAKPVPIDGVRLWRAPSKTWASHLSSAGRNAVELVVTLHLRRVVPLDELFGNVTPVGLPARALPDALVGHVASDDFIVALCKRPLDWVCMPHNRDKFGALSIGAGQMQMDPVGERVSFCFVLSCSVGPSMAKV